MGAFGGGWGGTSIYGKGTKQGKPVSDYTPLLRFIICQQQRDHAAIMKKERLSLRRKENDAGSRERDKKKKMAHLALMMPHGY